MSTVAVTPIAHRASWARVRTIYDAAPAPRETIDRAAITRALADARDRRDLELAERHIENAHQLLDVVKRRWGLT